MDRNKFNQLQWDLQDLKKIKSEDKLMRIIESLIGVVSSQKEEIEKLSKRVRQIEIYSQKFK